MENLIGVEQVEAMVDSHGQVVETAPATFQMATASMLPFPKMEAALNGELDRVLGLADQDPMEALNQILRLMQGMDFELFKAMAPRLLESAQMDAALYAAGNGDKSGKTNGREMASMLKLQESIGKLGAARVKVRDEQVRRGSVRVPKPLTA
jgi:hypothetical protein